MDQEMNQNTSEVLAVCPRKKKDKKPVTFYSDRMIFNDETIPYSEIESVSTYSSAMRYNFIFENLTTYIHFKLKDGRKLKWKNGGNSLFGLGSVKAKWTYYIAAFTATMSTVVKVIAARYIETVRQGGTIKIGGVTITPTEISGKRIMKMTTTPLSELAGTNYGVNSVAILRKDNKTAVNGTPCNVENALCLVYIINTLIGNQDVPGLSSDDAVADNAE